MSCRGVAQTASALRLGRRGRRFKSGRPDWRCQHVRALQKGIAAAFQAAVAGSIPAARSRRWIP